jgi:serine protease Do
MGVTIQELDSVTREVLGISGSRGILVDAVADGSPAARAGLKASDVILSFGGESTGTTDRLGALVQARKPGERVRLVVLRKGRELQLDLELGSR